MWVNGSPLLQWFCPHLSVCQDCCFMPFVTLHSTHFCFCCQIMPRKSKRQKVIEKKKAVIKELEALLELARLDEEDSDGTSSSELEFWQDIHEAAVQELETVESKRCLERGPCRSSKTSESRFQDDLDKGMDESSIPWLKPDEFLEKHRMSRETFWDLVELIKDDPQFQKTNPSARDQRPVPHQLMITLKAFSSGGSFSNGLKKKEEDTNNEWMDEDDDVSTMEDPSRLFGEGDELHLPVPEGSRSDMRRDQLMCYAIDELD